MGKDNYYMTDEEYALVTRKTPIPTVNIVVFRKVRKKWEILLIVRKTGYAKGNWCFIGGRVWIGETLRHAIKRQEKDLGVKVRIIPPFNSNFPAFIDDRKNQDKTKIPLSFIYPAEIVSGKIREEGEEYKGYKWFPIDRLPKIGYGQKYQIKKTIDRMKALGKL